MSFTESALDILSNPGIGNALLLAAAIIGVLGSYGIYLTKLSHQRERLRVALIYELRCLEEPIRKLEANPEEAISENPLPEIFFENEIYENNTDKIGILSPMEVGVVTDFYTSATLVQKSAERNPDGLFIGITNEELYKKLLRAFEELNSNVDDAYRPDTDDFKEPVETLESDKPL